jgi:hypothetical protein
VSILKTVEGINAASAQNSRKIFISPEKSLVDRRKSKADLSNPAYP